MAEAKSTEPVHLEPFIHQVGGHSHMFSLDDTTVCKPLISRERSFYETMPEEMKPFVPEYKGVIEAKFVEDSDGFVTLMAYVPKSYERKLRSELRTRRRIRLRRSGRIEVVGEQKCSQVFEEADGTATTDTAARVPHNPWLLNCAASVPTTSPCSNTATAPTPKYILLENLTHRYRYPCVLDLKMGTRQYADDDSTDKQESKKAKVASSTSGTLGVRVNGMQVYDMELGRYICRSKYYGRRLSEDGFRAAMCQFVSGRLRAAVVPRLLQRLRRLREVLQRLDTCRFFTSSLLLIYDADAVASCSTSEAAAVDVRMIDFAHATHGRLHDPVQHQGPDRGLLFGLENLLLMLEAVPLETS